MISNRSLSNHRECLSTCRGTGCHSCYEDRASLSKGNYESDHHREKNSNEQPFSKKRQRTTFSPIEVGELERVFKRRPFLTPEDEDGLVQRLGITPKNVKVSKRYVIILRDLCHLGGIVSKETVCCVGGKVKH